MSPPAMRLNGALDQGKSWCINYETLSDTPDPKERRLLDVYLSTIDPLPI